MAADGNHLGSHRISVVIIGGQGDGRRRSSSVFTKAMPVQPFFSILGKTPAFAPAPPLRIGRKLAAVTLPKSSKPVRGRVESILNHAV